MTVRNNDVEFMADDQDCADGQRSPLPKDPVVAMAYVPFQQYNSKNIYSAEEGFRQGTIFPDLDKPFTGWTGDWK